MRSRYKAVLSSAESFTFRGSEFILSSSIVQLSALAAAFRLCEIGMCKVGHCAGGCVWVCGSIQQRYVNAIFCCSTLVKFSEQMEYQCEMG